MSAAAEQTLLEQRERRCRELQAQRAVIARELGAPVADGLFPRSHTMRLLARRPLQALRLAVGLVGLLRGR